MRYPFGSLEWLGKIVFDFDEKPQDNGAVPRATRQKAANVHIYHLITEPHVAEAAMSKNRPAMIFSSDDYIRECHPLNPAFAHLGTKLPSGRILTPGDYVNYKNADGEDQILWDDGNWYGDKYFNIAQNHFRLALHDTIARASDGVLVTCDPLARVYKDLGCDNVFIFPNCLNFVKFPEIRIVKDPGTVKILWQGGDSHYVDWHALIMPLKRVLEKYKHAKMVFFGRDWEAVKKHIAPEQYEFIDWVPYEAFHLRLATIGHDINLCPLVQNAFNECKSAIKWYESSALTEPAATLAANTGPYKEIEDNVTGLLYNTTDEFEEKLGALIEDATLRQELGKNAKEWVHEHRDVLKECPKLYSWLQETYANYCAKRGRPWGGLEEPDLTEPPNLVVRPTGMA